MYFKLHYNSLGLVTLGREPGTLDAALQVSHVRSEINIGLS